MRRRSEPPTEDDRPDPTTPEEWQFVVALAEAFLRLDAAKQYGLVISGPVVDVARCEELLERAQQAGIAPATESDIDAALATTLVDAYSHRLEAASGTEAEA
jgi:hypothetical protein